MSDPNFLRNIQAFIGNNRAEAAYFSPLNSERSAIFIVDVPSIDRVPVIAVPFFQMAARVEFYPAMNFEELKKGLSSIRQ